MRYSGIVWILNFVLLFTQLTACHSGGENAIQESETFSPVLVMHGGAGTITQSRMTPEKEAALKKAMEEALNQGYSILDTGGTAIEAVIQAIRVLEQSPLFNAGKGAVFTSEGTIELDASIMDGANGEAGAVAGVSHIKSPIEAAFYVMTESPHVLLTGKGAEEFARMQGLEMADPSWFYTGERYEQLKKIQGSAKFKEQEEGQYAPALINHKFGTVGAVALDRFGNLAAGTSTGGMTNKRFGRVGDSPIIGAGTYADNNSCAVSSTGHGEYFIRYVVAYDIAARMKYEHKPLNEAATGVISELEQKGGSGGVICLDRKGNIAMPFNTEGMYRGYIREENQAVIAFYSAGDIR